jgi:methylthioribose-1-phosphate isomerase
MSDMGKIMSIYPIKRVGDSFELIDQVLLPQKERYFVVEKYQDMISAIKTMQIRGAPAIGIAALAGVFLACRQYRQGDYQTYLQNVIKEIEQSRPTAVNLFYATQKVKVALEKTKKLNPDTFIHTVSNLVDDLMRFEYESCDLMAFRGADFIPNDITRFLTICNTGALATYGSGTALSVIKKIASRQYYKVQIYVCETRPLLQGARLTIWELQKSKIPATLITDSMAAWAIKTKDIQAIIVGADRIAKNGDTANKIGTLSLAILARHFQIPFYVVAPESTIDMSLETGADIVIEERGSVEVTHIAEKQIAADKTVVYNPSFDVTPKSLITAIITNKRVIVEKPSLPKRKRKTRTVVKYEAIQPHDRFMTE